ncbi:hypothetical protein BD779DRAFT_1477010 [Infundibulicybe gibba]|nr:hypothetical protein BD779DRAFT_1477010 [Infundibulicybe gibba]
MKRLATYESVNLLPPCPYERMMRVSSSAFSNPGTNSLHQSRIRTISGLLIVRSRVDVRLNKACGRMRIIVKGGGRCGLTTENELVVVAGNNEYDILRLSPMHVIIQHTQHLHDRESFPVYTWLFRVGLARGIRVGVEAVGGLSDVEAWVNGMGL